MVRQERILVPLGAENRDLTALYHALALAERIKAKVFILLFKPLAGESEGKEWVEEALLDVTNSACQDGLSVSYHIVQGPFEREVLNLVREEHIDLIVFGAEQGPMERSLRRIRSKLPSKIIKVEKRTRPND